MEMHHNGIAWYARGENLLARDVATSVGIIPTFFHELDTRTAAEQVMEHYIGGWDSFKGFELNTETEALSYKGDPDMHPVAYAVLPNGESVYIYPFGWTMILQPDGETFDVARLD